MSELTVEEQKNVRAALRFLRTRTGRWAIVAQALRLGEGTVSEVASGRVAVSPLLAFRVARLAKVTVDDVLTGRFPAPGTCPHCGHCPAKEAAE